MKILECVQMPEAKLPMALMPANMDWILYKQGELYPNGYRVCAGNCSKLVGLSKHVKHDVYKDGCVKGMDVPDWWATFTESQLSINVIDNHSRCFKMFTLEFDTVKERDTFINTVLEATHGSHKLV